MDPNAALANLREAIALQRAETTDDKHRTQFRLDALDAAEALDEWISGGGFLPDAWETYEPRVEVLHERDSDTDCRVTVYLHERRQRDDTVDVVTVDPGRGYTLSDWLESYHAVAAAEGRTEPFLSDALTALNDASTSRYIEDDPDAECVLCVQGEPLPHEYKRRKDA